MEILGGSDMLLLKLFTSSEQAEMMVLGRQGMVVCEKNAETSFNGATLRLAAPG